MCCCNRWFSILATVYRVSKTLAISTSSSSCFAFDRAFDNQISSRSQASTKTNFLVSCLSISSSESTSSKQMHCFISFSVGIYSLRSFESCTSLTDVPRGNCRGVIDDLFLGILEESCITSDREEPNRLTLLFNAWRRCYSLSTRVYASQRI